MNILNSKERVTCILHSKFDDVVGSIFHLIKSRGNIGPDGVVVFSDAIYATTLSTGLETSSG